MGARWSVGSCSGGATGRLVPAMIAAYGPASSPQDGARTSKTGAAILVAPASLLGVARPVRSGAACPLSGEKNAGNWSVPYPITGTPFQARHSYTADEIVWDHDFQPAVTRAADGKLQAVR